MIAEQRTRTVHHHEWTLRSPAHYTDVAAAIQAAEAHRARQKGATTDVTVRAEDNLLVVGYQAEPPAKATRSAYVGPDVTLPANV